MNLERKASSTNPFSAVMREWPLLLIGIALSVLGILTMHPFATGSETLAVRQSIWLLIAIGVYATLAFSDLHFMRRTPSIVAGYAVVVVLLGMLLIFAHSVQGAKSWFSLGAFSFQPADLAKLVFIAFLAKYFSRRHVEMKHPRHVLISGAYAAVIILLVLVQPDLGTAAILGSVWLGLILVSGISKKHLAIMFVLGAVAVTGLWFFGLHDYQRTRIVAFINPAADIRGAGYNAYQAVVAVGSGEVFGKGIGYGTQSKLRFLPEYETDFIFAAFAEEWGFIGVGIVLTLYGLLLTRLLSIARHAGTNFDAFFTLGVAILFTSHLFIHAGINLGLLPVTGTTIPFMSYGGSHLVMEFAALGIVASLARQGRSAPRTSPKEFPGG